MLRIRSSFHVGMEVHPSFWPGQRLSTEKRKPKAASIHCRSNLVGSIPKMSAAPSFMKKPSGNWDSVAVQQFNPDFVLVMFFVKHLVESHDFVLEVLTDLAILNDVLDFSNGLVCKFGVFLQLDLVERCRAKNAVVVLGFDEQALGRQSDVWPQYGARIQSDFPVNPHHSGVHSCTEFLSHLLESQGISLA